MKSVSFKLNGTPRQAQVQPEQTLLDVLRETFRVTSVKDACSPQGLCGCSGCTWACRSVPLSLKETDFIAEPSHQGSRSLNSSCNDSMRRKRSCAEAPSASATPE